MAQIFVEGDDDKRLIDVILKQNGISARIIDYAGRNKKDIDKYFQSLNPEKYFVLADIDYKKNDKEILDRLNKRFPHICQTRIILVKMEIESWYIAGVNENLRITHKYAKIPANTETLCKEKVYSMIKNGKNRDILSEMIFISKNFDQELAKSRNNSLLLFIGMIQEWEVK